MGSTVGSALIPKVGIRVIYLAFGITAVVTAALYMFGYHTVLKHYEQRRLESNKEDKSQPSWLISSNIKLQ